MKQPILIRTILTVGVVAFLAFAPLILTILQIRMINEIAYFALFAVSFNFLFGYAGLLSFGHASYFGLGAYLTALSLKHVEGMPLLLSIIIGGLAGGIGGLIIGFFCVRRKGAYFALLTLAFNQFLWAIAWKWREVTHGEDGIGKIVPKIPINLGIVSFDPASVTGMYYLSITIVLICLALCWYITKTSLGNTILAIKANEERAEFLGYNVNRSKLVIFTIAAFFAGIAGSIFALFQDFVTTSSIDLSMSTQVLFMAFLGGTGSFFGPILGAAIYVYFTDWVSNLTDRWEFILGILFILLVLYLHRGFIGLIPNKVKSIFASEKAF